MDFIQGEKFERMADFAYAPPKRHQDDYRGLVNTFDINKLRDRNIVFTTPFYVIGLLDIIKDLPQKFVIVTHNGDNRIDDGGVTTLDGAGNVVRTDAFIIPDNVIKWFAQNVNALNPRIESIPIGLENDMWFPEIDKKSRMIAKLQEPKSYRNLVYMNHTERTNAKERTILYELLEHKPWVDSVRYTNGYEFGQYIDNVYNHKFVVCPQGNGMDTHRTWETLYMGSIPIEKRNRNNRFYNNLPICFVNEWEEITEDFLIKTWKEIEDIKSYFDGDKDILTFKYWENKIRDAVL